MKSKFVLTCMFFLIARLAEGATLEYKRLDSSPDQANNPVNFRDLTLSGEIKTGDAKKLLAMLLDPKSPYFSGVIVNSPGGSVDEAIKIAKLVKSLYTPVSVDPNGYCASACFFIFLAGSGRSASPAELMGTAERRVQDESLRKHGLPPTPGSVGLHRPFLTRIDGLNNKQSDGMRFVASYLEGELLPRRLIDLMMSKPSNDIYWLKDDDLAGLGDYPPEQEEYFIQKCGYDRNHIAKVLASRDRSTIRKITEKALKANDCMSQVTSDANSTTMRKLKSGWLPY